MLFVCEQPLRNNRYRIAKSRYASIDSYLSPCSARCNDIELVKDEQIYQQLVDNGTRLVLAASVLS